MMLIKQRDMILNNGEYIRQVVPKFAQSYDDPTIAIISCPGSSSYIRVYPTEYIL
jgi:hypothetical protein